jgi:hypothetical protein
MDENINVNEEINDTEGNEEVENAENGGANEPTEIVSAKPQFLMVKKDEYIEANP